MELNVNPAMREWVLDRLTSEYRTPKPTPHSTQLIYCLTNSYYELYDPLPLTERELLLFSVGFGMERVLLGKTKDSPLKVDGIYVSPDFMMVEGEWGELKTTRMKPPAHGAEMPLPEGWVKQIKAYCHCIGVTHYNLAVLHVIQPALTTWRLDFTPEELLENWEWIKYRLATLVGYIGDVEPPIPFTYNMEWECGYCNYRPRCELARLGGRV